MSKESCVKFLMKWEHGNYVPKPGDRNNDSNPTRDGIIQRTYNRYRRNKDLPLRSVFDAPGDEWGIEWNEIFTDGFYVASGADRLPAPLDLVIVDVAFNSGTGQSVKFLQRAVGTLADGKFGPITEKAALAANPRETSIRVIGQRVRFLRDLHKKSLERITEWEKLSPEEQEARIQTEPAKYPPEEFPLEGLLTRVKDLERTAGLLPQRPAA